MHFYSSNRGLRMRTGITTNQKNIRVLLYRVPAQCREIGILKRTHERFKITDTYIYTLILIKVVTLRLLYRKTTVESTDLYVGHDQIVWKHELIWAVAMLGRAERSTSQLFG